MLIKSADNKLDIFECIYFGKNADESEFTLYLNTQSTSLVDEYKLWLDIQRDILLSIIQDYYVIVHLDKSIDKLINKLYFVTQNEIGDYFIEIPPNDIRLLTELVNDSLVWECGNLLKIAAFKDRPTLQNKTYNFEKAEVVLHSFEDNLGFNIKICDMKNNEVVFYNKVEYMLNKYHIIEGGYYG